MFSPLYFLPKRKSRILTLLNFGNYGLTRLIVSDSIDILETSPIIKVLLITFMTK